MSLELSGTTGVKGVAGSVSAPSIVGDDTNTGISFPSADTIKFSTGGVERMQITNSGVTGTGIGAGKILQVVQTHYSDRVSNTTASGAEWAPSQLNCAITPSATSSKVLITAKVAIGFNVNTRRVFLKAFRDSTQIAQGDADSGNTSISRASSSVDIRADDVVEDIIFQYLDSPNTTSATTYSFRFIHSQTADGIIYINRAHAIQNRDQDAHLSSNVTLQEVGA
tara:strand:- start:98 stop:769 length:672 start_codon:yes stop_codon:yes gene_type:complete